MEREHERARKARACALHSSIHAMAFEVGQVLCGTIRLVRPIAEGGMGSIWRGQHLLLGTDVAVKAMSKHWAAMPTARTRFLREARMTAAIDSPHVVRVLDCRLTSGDEPYLVLELLPGETLEHRVARRGVLSLFETAEIVGQTCEALAATHAAGFVHRDVKPDNVYLAAGHVHEGHLQEPFVKLLDFGVARPVRASECLDVDRLAAGTPRFMSPEQMFEPENVDPRADLFSVAAVAYFALTMSSPFEAPSLDVLYLAMEDARFKPASQRRPELPLALDAWFARALAREPADRFQTASEMAAALYDVVRHLRDERPTLPDGLETSLSASTPSGGQVRVTRPSQRLSQTALPVSILSRKARTIVAVTTAVLASIVAIGARGAFVSNATAETSQPGRVEPARSTIATTTVYAAGLGANVEGERAPCSLCDSSVCEPSAPRAAGSTDEADPCATMDRARLQPPAVSVAHD